MSGGPYVLGIDVGSVSVNLALLTPEGEVAESRYVRHLGHPNRVVAQAVRELLQDYPPDTITLVAATGTGSRRCFRDCRGLAVAPDDYV